MNVIDQTPIRECTSCQICAAVCNHNAISIRLNKDGFYRPYIDEKSCTNCGLCTRFCYKFDKDVRVTDSEKLRMTDVYSAQLLSDSLLEKVTSGGIADALAKELVRQGYVCIGVAYRNDRAEHVVAVTEKDTDAFRGSKYIQPFSYDAFKELVKNVGSEKYAIFGLPCHIYAISRYLSFRHIREKCVLIDLFCHGCPSMHVWTKYEKDIRKRTDSEKIDDVEFRSKVKGWGAFHVTVKSGDEIAFVSTPKTDEFYSLFFSDTVLNDACSGCKLRSTMEYTDIRLGDFWGKRYLSDRKGVSAVVIASENGRQIFNAVKDSFKTEKSSMNEVLVKQSYGKVYTVSPVLRKLMLDALRDEHKSLKEVERLYYKNQGLVPNLKRLIKLIDWYLPFDLMRLLKRFA